MSLIQDPKWLRTLSRHLGWLAIPNIAVIFLTLQAIGFFFVLLDPVWVERFALIPGLALSGEPWRLITFLALPLSNSLIGIIFALWFLYFILNLIENEWGAFKTTFYILVSLACTLTFSFVFSYPIFSVQDLVSSLFLAAAALFPDFEVRVYLAIPVKLKFLGWLALGFVGLRFLQGSWLDRLLLVTIYSNYLIFFGPSLLYRVKEWKRKRDFRARSR